MPHPHVSQLRFARSEFVRGLDGVKAGEATRRFGPMNCISWIVGHLTSQEQAYWLTMAQGRTPYPDLYQLVGSGQPASTPPLAEMWEAWRAVTAAADPYLNEVDTATLLQHFERDGQPMRESIGSMMQRNFYHYWFHIGEAAAIRQMLGHTDLPQFVGNMSMATFQTPDDGQGQP